ncbi:H-type lectin domain-containing protein [Gemmobacter lanyuensis]
MRRFNTSSLGILQGSRVLFSDFADGGVMWTGQGPRESRFIVTFKEAFLEPPVVMVGLSMWDIDNMHNSRVDISAEAITPQGFHIVFKTWGIPVSRGCVPTGPRWARFAAKMTGFWNDGMKKAPAAQPVR